MRFRHKKKWSKKFIRKVIAGGGWLNVTMGQACRNKQKWSDMYKHFWFMQNRIGQDPTATLTY